MELIRTSGLPTGTIYELLNTMNFDIQKQIGCSCTIPAISSVNHSCLRCVKAIYCLINFISINMHRIHFLFVLLNCKICCYFSFPFRKVRNCAQQICWIPLEIASTSTWRQGKLFYKLLLLFTFCFFDVYSSTGKAMQRIQGWNGFSAPWRCSCEGLLSKGIVILLYIDLDSGWNSIQTWISSCSTTKCDNNCILYIFMTSFRL